MKLGKNRIKRIKVISTNLVNNSSPLGTWQVEVAGKQIPLKIFHVPVDFPKYRINNGRTLSAQQEYIADKSLDEKFFDEADYEAQSTQEIQHEILKRKIEKTDKVNIIQKFKKVPQKEPLMLTNDGFVLNGNRRLCAMRVNFYSDKNKFSNFKDIQVVALPHLDEGQLQEIEAKLQLQTNWQQDYSWIDRAFIYANQTKLGGLSAQQIAARDGKKPKEINETINLIPIVNSYLDWIGKPKKYSEISDQEFSFRRILENWDKLKKPGEKDLLRNVSFQLIKNEHSGRTYIQIPELRKAMPKLVDELAKELSVERENLKKINEKIKTSEGDDGVNIVDIAVNVIETEQSNSKKIKNDMAFISQIRAANTALHSAITLKQETSKLDGLDGQIKGIEKSLSEIKTFLIP